MAAVAVLLFQLHAYLAYLAMKFMLHVYQVVLRSLGNLNLNFLNL